MKKILYYLITTTKSTILLAIENKLQKDEYIFYTFDITNSGSGTTFIDLKISFKFQTKMNTNL